MNKTFMRFDEIDKKQKIPFDMEVLPKAFFSENSMSRKLRNKLNAKHLTHENSIDSERLSQIFYSDDNIELINKQIVLKVFKETQGKIKIPFQSKDDLMVVMRWVYINYARNLPFKIKEQIRSLNSEVMVQVVPKLISQANQHLDYLRDINKPFEPIPHPVNVSRDRTLPSISEIYHGNDFDN